MLTTEPSKPRRLELILRQIDSLPTLPAIATRLLSLTASDDTHAREVIELVSADPALTAKVLALCRTADRGVRDTALTVDRAVVLLGFNAVRSAVLSVKVFEMFSEAAPGSVPGSVPGSAPGSVPGSVPGSATAAHAGSERSEEPDRKTWESRPPHPALRRASGPALHTPRNQKSEIRNPEISPAPAGFDRVAFWSHSLAVGIMAELIAAEHPGDPDLKPDDAFVCGLLHDIGKLALDHVLPKSFARVVELTDLNHGNIAEYERRVVGLDHHTAGKRLAEQWKLPHRLQDCIWLHGASYDALPRLEHRRLVGLVSLADLIARRQHVGYSGNYSFNHDIHALTAKLGLNDAAVAQATRRLHEQLEVRGRALGLHDQPSRELFLQSIQSANHELGRLNQTLELRSRTAASQTRILEAITAFHAAAHPGRSVQDVLDSVVASARPVLGDGFYATLYPGDPYTGERRAWLISQYDADGRAPRAQCIETPPHAPDLASLDTQQPMGLDLLGVLPWITDYLVDAEDLRRVKLLPLSSGWGTAAVLLHDRANLPAWPLLASLTSTWGAAIAAATQHDGARRLGEQLAESNSALAEAQDHLLRQASMARLGEMAAGAAHEMNNPLAIISGRSQLLSMTLPGGSKEQQAARTVFQAAHRLSDLITTLRAFADPPQPERRPASLGALLDEAIKRVQANLPTGSNRNPPDISLRLKHQLPTMDLDPDQIRRAFTELLLNAVQANPKQSVQVVAQLAPGEQAVVVQVIDDGDGMDAHALDHALDPFFSAKPAGRRVGMGLPRAQQLISGHGGTLELRSVPGLGTTVTLTLPLHPEG